MADLLSEAQERYRDAIDATSSQRHQIAEDLKFSDPTNPQQWDETEKNQRERDPGGMRPCLVHDQIGQYVSNVTGQVEQSPPALHALPVNGGADKRVAEQLDGFFRHIEHASRAQQHYAWSLHGAARAGVGYLIVQPEYVDRALNWQEPRITSEGDPLAVVFDPWSVELDGCDATFGDWLTPFSHREFERQFGRKAKKVNFGDEEGRIVDDERESVLVVTEWRVVNTSTNCIVFRTPTGDEASLPEDQFHEAKQREPALEFVRNYTEQKRSVRWARMSGADILTEDREFPADAIGIVPVYGYATRMDKRLKYCGMPRRAREPQRAYNFHISEIRAYMGQAPKAPWIGDARAFLGYEELWDRAAVDSRAYLPFNGVADDGVPIPPPARMPVAMNLQNHMSGALQAREDIQASLGMYAANIGKQSNAQSGVAYEAQKEQGEASTSHFPAHLKASISQVGKLCMQMIPRLMDTRRQLRTLSIDMTPSTVVLDPEQKTPLVEGGQGGLSINPNIGRYDVRVVVGPSFATQRSQTQAALSEVMSKNPQMVPAIAPLWAATLDMPNGDKLAQVLTAMAPDPVKAILDPNQQESTGALKAQIQQLQEALQEAIQHAKDAQAEADEAQHELQSKHLDAAAKSDEIDIKDYEAQTRRLQVLGTTITPEMVVQLTQQTIAQAMAQPQPSEEPVAGAVEAVAPVAATDQGLTPAAGAQVPQEPAMPAGPTEHEQEIIAGQEHLAQLMEMLVQQQSRLIQLVQHPRERIPVRNKAGDIERVIDRLEQQQEPAEAPQE